MSIPQIQYDDEKIKSTFVQKEIVTPEIYNELNKTVIELVNNNNSLDRNISIGNSVHYASNFEAMKSMNLVEGDLVITKGFYKEGDGGNGLYFAVSDIGSSELDGYVITQISNGLYLKLIINSFINVKHFGVYGDGVHDDTEAIQRAIDYAQRKNTEPVHATVFFPRGYYVISKTLDVNIGRISLIGESVRILYKQTDIVVHVHGHDVDDTKKSYGSVVRDISFFPFNTSNTSNRAEVGFMVGTDKMSDNRPARNITFKNVGFHRCNKCFYINNNAYIMQWEGCGSTEHDYFIYAPSIQGNSGENMVMRDCLVTYGRQYDIWIEQPNMQFRIHNTSFDAGTNLLHFKAPLSSLNMISFIDCHFEPKAVSEQNYITVAGNCCYANFVRGTFFNRQTNIKYWVNCSENGYANFYDCYFDTEKTTSRCFSNSRQAVSKGLMSNKVQNMWNTTGNMFNTYDGNYFTFGKTNLYNQSGEPKEVQAIIPNAINNIIMCGDLDTIYGITKDGSSNYNIGITTIEGGCLRAQHTSANFKLAIEKTVNCLSSNSEFPLLNKTIPDDLEKVVYIQNTSEQSNSVFFNVLAKNRNFEGGRYRGVFWVMIDNTPTESVKINIKASCINNAKLNNNLGRLGESFDLTAMEPNKLYEKYFMDVYLGITGGAEWIGWQFECSNFPTGTKLYIIEPKIFKV